MLVLFEKAGIHTTSGASLFRDHNAVPTDKVWYVVYGKHFLSLSDDQRNIIQRRKKLPLIINGTAGSGKTIVAHHLIMSAMAEEGMGYSFTKL